MRHLGKPSILVVWLTGAVLLGAAPASAEVGIAVSPALLELHGHAGDTGRVGITVSNSGDEAFEVLTGITTLQDMTGDHSAVWWSTVTPERFLLEPGDAVSAGLTINIPERLIAGDRTASGGRYATVTFTTVSPGEDGSAGMAGRIEVPVLLTVEGEGDLTRLPALERAAIFLEPDGRLGTRVDVHNAGNVHVPLTGTVELSSADPDIEASLGIPIGRVLPEVTRTYIGDATVPLPLESTYDVVVTMGLPSEDETMGEPLLSEAFQVDAVPSLDLADLAICENLDRGPSMSASLVNDGELGIVPRVLFEVLDEQGSSTGATPAASGLLAWPHETIDVSAESSDRLASGSYTLVASATFGLDQGIEARLPFTIGGDPTTAAPLCIAASPSPQLSPSPVPAG